MSVFHEHYKAKRNQTSKKRDIIFFDILIKKGGLFLLILFKTLLFENCTTIEIQKRTLCKKPFCTHTHPIIKRATIWIGINVRVKKGQEGGLNKTIGLILAKCVE